MTTVPSRLCNCVGRMVALHSTTTVMHSRVRFTAQARLPCFKYIDHLRHLSTAQQFPKASKFAHLRGQIIAANSIPDDDFDSTLISRRAFSSLEQPKSFPLPRSESTASSSSGSISELSDSETAGLSVKRSWRIKRQQCSRPFSMTHWALGSVQVWQPMASLVQLWLFLQALLRSLVAVLCTSLTLLGPLQCSVRK